MMPLSAQDVCFNANPDGCGGGQITTPWSYIMDTGAVTGGQNNGIGPFGSGYCSDYSLPHCHHHGPVKDDPFPAEGDPGCPTQSSPRGPTACDATAQNRTWDDDKYIWTGNRPQMARGVDTIKQFMMVGGPCEVAFSVFPDFEDYDSGVYSHTGGGQPVGGHAVKFVGWGPGYWKVANSWNPYWGEKGYFRIVMGDDLANGGIDAMCVGSPAGAQYMKKNGPRPPPPPPGPPPGPLPKDCTAACEMLCGDVKFDYSQCMSCIGHNMPQLEDFMGGPCTQQQALDYCGAPPGR